MYFVIISREKWTLYDEATHVPLVMYHPDSPHKGLRYEPSVESIDIFPTLNDILGAPFYPHEMCGHKNSNCPTLQGKSLGAVVMGVKWVSDNGGTKAQSIRARTASLEELKQNSRALRGSDSREDPFFVPDAIVRALPPVNTNFDDARERLPTRRLADRNSSLIPISLPHSFALSQVWRCAWKNDLIAESENPSKRDRHFWFDCDVSYKGTDQVNLMGYSVRSKDFRYTAYLHFDRATFVPQWELPPMYEELYDHRGDTAGDLGHRELINVVKRPGFEDFAMTMRTNLIKYLRSSVVYQHQLKNK